MPGYTEYVLAEGSFSYGQAVAVITAYRNVFIQDELFVSNVRPDTVLHIGCTALPMDGISGAKREKNLKDGTHSLSPV